MRLPGQLWLYTRPTDMRRSYDGLASMVRQSMGNNPLSGQGFVFINRRRTQLKCLYFDAGGYCIWGKRLERGRLGVPGRGQRLVRALTRTEFEALIEGLELIVKKRRRRWNPNPIPARDTV